MDEACAPVQIIHPGKFKSLDAQQRKWLKRRQAIEPAIGHTKSDNRMDLSGHVGQGQDADLFGPHRTARWRRLEQRPAARIWPSA